jgi:hypothetical protein
MGGSPELISSKRNRENQAKHPFFTLIITSNTTLSKFYPANIMFPTKTSL